MASRETPILATFAEPLEGDALGPSAGEDPTLLTTGGSGGSTMSATSRGALGASDGGCISFGINPIRFPGSADTI